MTNIFYDTEFLENGVTIQTISIGMVNEYGDNYYAIVRDLRLMQKAYDHVWLKDNVMKYIPIKVDDNGKVQWDKNHRDYPYVKGKAQIAKDLKHFVASHANPRLWAYYAAYDHVAMSQFYGRMIDLPLGMPMWTHELKQLMEEYPNASWPNQDDNLHNALDDAMWNKKVWEYIQFLKRVEAGGNGQR